MRASIEPAAVGGSPSGLLFGDADRAHGRGIVERGINEQAADSRSSKSGAPAVIVAGGASRRFGEDKAAARRPDGMTFLGSVIAAASAVTDTIVVIGPRREAIQGDEHVRWWMEPEPGNGPGPAVASFMETNPELLAEGAIVLACDYPWINARFLWSLERFFRITAPSVDTVIPYADGFLHPLLARYSAAGLGNVFRSERGSLRKRAASTQRVTIVPGASERRAVRNVNTPDALSF